jgi:hypothetical protein
VEINKLLVPFGKHVCTGVAPKMLDLSCPRHVSASVRNLVSLRPVL